MARILVVDDERSIRVTIREFLTDAGYQVFTSEDAAQALAIMEAEDFDVVLSDIILPGMTGVSLAKAIKEAAPNVQIILMTGEPNVATASDAVRAGAVDYLVKPIGKRALLRSVSHAAQIKCLDDERRRLLRENRQHRDNLERLVEERTAAWRESEERMKLALRGADLGTWDWNVRTGERTVDERWAGMLGYTLDEIEPHVRARTDLVHPDDVAGAEEALAAHLMGKSDSYEAELRLRHKSGDWVWVLDKGRVLERDADGQPLRICGTHLDITRRKKVEAELSEILEHTHRVQKMEAIGVLAGGIAHDFNNILSAVMGYNDLAMETVAADSETHGYLTEVSRASSRAKNLVSQILAISRPGTHEQKPIKLHIVVEEALRLLRETIPTTIAFQREINPCCSIVMADASQVHQVTMNLCTNAYHAMSEHGGTLTVRLDETQVEGGVGSMPEGLIQGRYVRLVVEDTGVGIAEDVIAHIFEPYYTTKEVGVGTGLGLATVFGIVEEHGGVINVRSEVGHGAAFEVYFPVHCGDLAVSRSEDRDSEPVPPGKGERILFVDDEQPIVAAYTAILQRLGYEVSAFVHSGEALQAFRANPDGFDLVITDQTMPGLTGIDLAKEILRIRSDIPVFLSTGYSASVSETVAKGVGLYGYLMKPLRRDELARSIRLALDKS